MSVSILSAAESTRPASVSGSGASAPSGRYCSAIARQTASECPASRAYSAPMTPSSSENSRTSSEAWSAFASRAASRASSPPAELLDELDEPLRLVGERTAALDERDPLEPSRELLDADRHVAIERERRVLEPRVEHPRVAGASDLHVAAGRHDRETIPAEREVALVALHGGDDHALGQAQEPLVELRPEDDRPLDHVHDLLELPERVLPVAERVERLDDAAAALGRVGLDVRRPQRVGVLLRGCDLDLAVREAVAEGLAGARQRLAVELLAVPPHRPREAMAARVPAHRLRRTGARGRSRACRSSSGSPRSGSPGTRAHRWPSRSSRSRSVSP